MRAQAQAGFAEGAGASEQRRGARAGGLGEGPCGDKGGPGLPLGSLGPRCPPHRLVRP